jgi:ATP-dependent Clp protease ATP-binding subunit ClpA
MLVATQARIAVYHAVTEARRMSRPTVDTADLLVGVTVCRDAVVRAVWEELDVDLTGMRRVLAAGRGQVDAGPAIALAPIMTHRYIARHRRMHPGRPMAFSAGARRVLGRAFTHARAHGARRLDAGHLLLAIADQAPGDPARGVLYELGVDADALAQAVCRRLSRTRRSCDGHPRDAAV